MIESEPPRRKVRRLSFGYDSRIAESRRGVGKIFGEYLKEDNTSLRSFADDNALQLGYDSPGDAYNKLICIRSGRKPGENYGGSEGLRFDDRELHRLSLLLGKIGVEQRDPLIDKLKKIEPRFRYELEPEKKKRVFLPGLKRNEKATKGEGEREG